MSAAVIESDSTRAMKNAATLLFEARLLEHHKRIDKWFGYLLVAQWGFGVLVALLFSPYSWAGKTQTINAHVTIAFVLGALINSMPLYLVLRHPGEALTRYTVAAGQALWSALIIHLLGGRIEAHFHVFGSLAFLASYRDWKVLVPATIVVALDHAIRQFFWPESAFGITNPEWWRFLEHAGWVAFEDVFLLILCTASIAEMKSLAKQQVLLEGAENMKKEMELAARIQTSILPKQPAIPGLEIAASMLPAESVGGDYYDVVPAEGGGSWIGIGDVAGHGITAGLIMLQAQSAAAALMRRAGRAGPAEILCELNRAVYENVRGRMTQDAHMTMSIVRTFEDGRVIMAGAHEEAIVCRKTGACEVVPIKGTWVGVRADIKKLTEETELRLDEGDVLVLYTDGVIETRNEAGEHYGIDRLKKVIARTRDEDVDRIRQTVLTDVKTWAGKRKPDDDLTVLVIRQVGLNASAKVA
jgi:serine phosphatase RsbU (regulator of sigma subunit)